MNVIEVTAPLSMDDLKKHFTDKDVFFNINYDKSELKGKKLLTYLSNLEIPSDVFFTDQKEYEEFLKEYLNSTLLVSLPSIENDVFGILSYFINNTKTKKTKVDQPNYYFDRNKNIDKFIESNKQILEKWVSLIQSLSLYNVYTVKNGKVFKDYIEKFPVVDDEDYSGINFISILKDGQFISLLLNSNQENFKFYENFYKKNIYKGKNLFDFWANEKNMLFVITFNLAENLLSKQQIEEYFGYDTTKE